MGKIKYQFRDLFESQFMDRFLAIYGLRPVNNLVGLEDILIQYKAKLEGVGGFWRSSGQYYCERVMIDKENYYEMIWGIKPANNSIRQNGLDARQLSLESIYPIVDQSCINRKHLDSARRNREPIIVALYPAKVDQPRLYVIDGNHRVVGKYEDGEPFITGYILAQEQHLPAMLTESHRTLYKIHYNYFKIASFIGGIITKAEMVKNLYLL